MLFVVDIGIALYVSQLITPRNRKTKKPEDHFPTTSSFTFDVLAPGDKGYEQLKCLKHSWCAKIHDQSIHSSSLSDFLIEKKLHFFFLKIAYLR